MKLVVCVQCDKCHNAGKNYKAVVKNGKEFHFCAPCIEVVALFSKNYTFLGVNRVVARLAHSSRPKRAPRVTQSPHRRSHRRPNYRRLRRCLLLRAFANSLLSINLKHTCVLNQSCFLRVCNTVSLVQRAQAGCKHVAGLLAEQSGSFVRRR